MVTLLAGLSAGEVRVIQAPQFLIGRQATCDLCLRDPGISRRHARIAGVAGGPYLIEDLSSTNGTFVNGRRTLKMKLRGGERIQLGPNVIIRFAFGDEQEQALAQKLYEASTRDALTQCYSRRYFDERLSAEVAYSRRHESPVSVILFDVDHFKRINDEHGHAAGDDVLRSIAAQVAKLIRAEDVFARHGGEEFILLVRGIRHKGVMRFAERVRAAIERLRVQTGDAVIESTVSLGVASLDQCRNDADPEGLVALADSRLYRAKRDGRNRICGD
jgi:two-component system, cell cycle response regulator